MSGPRMRAVYTVFAPNSWPIISHAITRRMALMTVTTKDTFRGIPATMNRFEMTMERPVMDPTTSLDGIRK